MKSKDLLILNTILAITPFAMYYVLWNPLFTGVGIELYSPATIRDSVNAYRGQVNEYDKTIKETKDLIAKYGKIVANYNSFDQSIFNLLQKSIPDTIEELPFVSEVTTLLQKNGLDAGKIVVSPGPDVNGVKVLTFSFKTKGSYEAIKNIIFAMEQNARFMVIRSMTITPPDENDGAYSFVAAVDVYKLK